MDDQRFSFSGRTVEEVVQRLNAGSERPIFSAAGGNIVVDTAGTHTRVRIEAPFADLCRGLDVLADGIRKAFAAIAGMRPVEVATIFGVIHLEQRLARDRERTRAAIETRMRDARRMPARGPRHLIAPPWMASRSFARRCPRTR